MEKLLERFLHYVKIDTQSDESSDTCPSTEKQKNLARVLVEEMLEMGIADAHMDENGYVFGTVPGAPDMPVIGMIAHLDTATNISGANVQPRVVTFQGEDILLNEQEKIWLRVKDYPHLADRVGQQLVVTDGTTLLGADDKAGVAEIMTVAEILLSSGEKHATVKIAFTPDEEIGRGANRFPVEKFGAEYAYTVDDSKPGGICYENFNADSATVQLRGRDVHPGSAKDKMVNSQLVAMEFQNLLPAHQVPEHTEGREGYISLMGIRGSVEATQMSYIIRDHSLEKFREKKAVMEAAATFLNTKYGPDTATVTFREGYRNMAQALEGRMEVVDRAIAAIQAAGCQVEIEPIRGGTDGARLSYMGLPCPNLGYGGYGAHSRMEHACVTDMEKCVQILLQILKAN